MSCAGVENQTKGAPVAPDVAVSCQLASRRQDSGEQIISSSQAAADKMGCFCCCSFRETAGLPGTSPVSSAYRVMCLSQANSHNCDANIAEAWRTAGALCLPCAASAALACLCARLHNCTCTDPLIDSVFPGFACLPRGLFPVSIPCVTEPR